MSITTYSPFTARIYRMKKYIRAQTYLFGWKWLLGRRKWNGNTGAPPGGWV